MKKILMWIAIVIGVIVVVGLVLPRTWHVETSVEIDADQLDIYPLIATPRKFVTFIEAYSKSQPEMAETEFEYEFGEIEEGAGAWWISRSPGSVVRIEISRSDDLKGIWYDGAIQQDEVNDHGSILYETTTDGKTKLTWTDDGELPLVIGGYLALFMDFDGTLETFFHGTLLEVKKAAEAAKAAEEAE